MRHWRGKCDGDEGPESKWKLVVGYMLTSGIGIHRRLNNEFNAHNAFYITTYELGRPEDVSNLRR